MKSRRWKWVGLGAIAAIAVGTAVATERRRRRWRAYDTAEIRTRLHERFAALDGESDHRPVTSRPDGLTLLMEKGCDSEEEEQQ